jgi:O-acetyl-ADP-ribose deacetylase (regulator of RNase III)
MSSTQPNDAALLATVNTIIVPYGALAVELGADAVGVMGDDRTVGASVYIRFPPDFSHDAKMTVSGEIINKVKGIARVLQDIVFPALPKLVQGDLIKQAKIGEFDVIVHGCNCFCAMGAGIALSVKTEFPEAFAADKKTIKGVSAKLGTCSTARCVVDGGRNGQTLDVVNAYTQFHWKGDGVLVDYDAVRSCMRWVKANYTGKRIGLPKIGAGLARGDWHIIFGIIYEVLQGEDVTIIEFV